jgi:Pre-toxin TG
MSGLKFFLDEGGLRAILQRMQYMAEDDLSYALKLVEEANSLIGNSSPAGVAAFNSLQKSKTGILEFNQKTDNLLGKIKLTDTKLTGSLNSFNLSTGDFMPVGLDNQPGTMPAILLNGTFGISQTPPTGGGFIGRFNRTQNNSLTELEGWLPTTTNPPEIELPIPNNAGKVRQIIIQELLVASPPIGPNGPPDEETRKQIEELADQIIEVLGEELLEVLSLLLDFVPVVGFVKGLIEAATGYDCITGRKLEDWERNLAIGFALVSIVFAGIGAAKLIGKARKAWALSAVDRQFAKFAKKYNLDPNKLIGGKGFSSFADLRRSIEGLDYATYKGLSNSYKQFLANGGKLSPGEFMVAMTKYRAPGLPLRADGGWLKGQLTDAQFEIMRAEAQRLGKPIYLCGSLSETNLGLYRRYTISEQIYLPGWRQEKPNSNLVDFGSGDFDVWEGSNLTLREREEIALKLHIIKPNLPEAELELLLDLGYSLKKYPTAESLGDPALQGGGALAFYPNGEVKRIRAFWQTAKWPPENISPQFFRAGTKGAEEIPFDEWIRQQLIIMEQSPKYEKPSDFSPPESAG